MKIQEENVAAYINDYFINVGKVNIPEPNADADAYTGLTDDDTGTEGSDPGTDNLPPGLNEFRRVLEIEVLRIVKGINVSKSSGLNNVSSFIVKEAFLAIVPEITHMFTCHLIL